MLKQLFCKHNFNEVSKEKINRKLVIAADGLWGDFFEDLFYVVYKCSKCGKESHKRFWKLDLG
jgi:hypothetical protein